MATTRRINGGAFPPIVHEGPDVRISYALAQERVEEYLEESNFFPCLYPSAIVNEDGCVLPENTDNDLNVPLLQLDRIARGIAGENLGHEPILDHRGYAISTPGFALINGRTVRVDRKGRPLTDKKMKKKKKNAKERRAKMNGTRLKVAMSPDSERENISMLEVPGRGLVEFKWQDMDEYQREQGILEGNIAEDGRLGGTGQDQRKSPILRDANGVPIIRRGDAKERREKKLVRRNEARQEKERMRAREGTPGFALQVNGVDKTDGEEGQREERPHFEIEDVGMQDDASLDPALTRDKLEEKKSWLGFGLPGGFAMPNWFSRNKTPS